MKELEKEIEEMKELVREKVKEPAVKRRWSLPETFGDEDDKDDVGSKQSVKMSCFNDGVDFTNYKLRKEEDRYGRLEWRA
mmetsp:Transcript_32848/g.50204  ORF Transcript_32848/g.50204 Transcript_32848/m.50204 type:complete len:80 (+) Transcript_32848:299-538(+)